MRSAIQALHRRSSSRQHDRSVPSAHVTRRSPSDRPLHGRVVAERNRRSVLTSATAEGEERLREDGRRNVGDQRSLQAKLSTGSPASWLPLAQVRVAWYSAVPGGTQRSPPSPWRHLVEWA